MRAHRRVAVVGVVVLVLGAAFAAGVVAIATGRSGHDAVVFARTAKLTAARGVVAKGLYSTAPRSSRGAPPASKRSDRSAEATR